ncbi:hypothetical protein ABG067_003497 [Albugo candida]
MYASQEVITTSKSSETLKFLTVTHEFDEVVHGKHGLVSLLFDQLAAFVTQHPEAMKRLDCYRKVIGHHFELIHYLSVNAMKFKLCIPEVERFWQNHPHQLPSKNYV